jgi:type IV pilus assembly protein PilQ
VPLLGDIPYMGWLFKNRVQTTRKTELLVFITPKIVTERTAAR